jgi:hypothetical protein
MIQINAVARLPTPKSYTARGLTIIEVGALAVLLFGLAGITFVPFSILATS